jgi:hypothetical protein
MIRIENPNNNLGPSGFVFNPDSGVRVAKFDPGFPALREVVDEIPQGDGTKDYTSFFGARPISLEFMIYAPWARSVTNRRAILDTLYGLCNPRLRPFLYESIDGQAERRIMLRPDNLSAAFVMPHMNIGQLSFVAPLGIWESGELEIANIGPGTGGATNTGRSYDLSFDRTYVSRAPAGGQVLEIVGNIETYPAMIIYGPCTAVTIGNETTGKEMVFPGLTLLAGESIVINMKDRSIVEGDQPTVSRYEEVDWTQSSWIPLVPGENQLSFNPTGYGDSTRLSVAYRHNWI